MELTLGCILEADIEHGIVQSAAHEKFETKIVDALGIAESLTLLGAVPVENELVAERQAGGGVCSVLVAVEHASGKGSLDMADDLLLKVLGGLEGLSLTPLPGLTLRFRN
jgi:hypothetical protein